MKCRTSSNIIAACFSPKSSLLHQINMNNNNYPYLSPSPSPSPSPYLIAHHKRSTIALNTIIPIASLSLFALLLILFLSILHNKRRHHHALIDPYEHSLNTISIHHAHSHPLADIDAITDGFHPSNIIGKGRTCTVYKATCFTGEVVAVKRIHSYIVLSNAGVLDFSSKLKPLSFINHPNVVSILGYSEAPGERIIVCEFVGRSLESRLHDDEDSKSLSWGVRSKIAACVARGIEHLHEGISPGMVHGRVKPSNILVHENFNAKVCDFNLSFMERSNHRRSSSGYMDNEGKEEESKENDVYGVGVVLLEILSGRKCEGGMIVEWALPLIRMGRVDEMLDTRLNFPTDGIMRNLVRMARVALACVGNEKRSRPSIVQVSAILSSLDG